MAEEKSQLIAAVVSRLNILRAELDEEERSILDAIVLGESAEVSGHAASTAMMQKVFLDKDQYVLRSFVD